MNRMYGIATLIILFILPAAGQEEARLTLEDAIRIGREQSKTLQASRARSDASQAKAREAGTALLPAVKFDASYRRLSDIPPFAVQLPFAGMKPIVISPTILDNYSLRATVQQPLFTGFRLRNNVRAADLQAEAGTLDVQNDEADLVVNITTAYWGLYQIREVKRSVDENVTRLETYERDVQNLLRAGMATRNDLLRIQVQLSTARLSQIDAANDLQVAAMNLNMAMGRPVDAPVDVASEPEQLSDSTKVPPAAELTKDALSARPDLIAMKNRVEASRATVSAANGGWWPQLFLSANYYYSKPNPRLLPAQNIWKDTWDVGVQFQWDVWNWGATAAQADQASAGLAANEALFEQMQQSVALDVQRQALAVSRAAQKVSVARLGVGQAEENVRITSDKFRSGLATSSELLDANVALLQARTSLTGSLVEAEVARVKLGKATGRLR